MSGENEHAYTPTLSVRTSQKLRLALEAFAASKGITRSAAACEILEDWLRTHGWAADQGGNYCGPATDAIAAMAEAIKKDRQRK